ncbi:MAG: hypothetical protein KKH04_15405 [Proteobacteria bacterium]|nr:hypothetical protein [Pseudomonadota bacterium]
MWPKEARMPSIDLGYCVFAAYQVWRDTLIPNAHPALERPMGRHLIRVPPLFSGQRERVGAARVFFTGFLAQEMAVLADVLHSHSLTPTDSGQKNNIMIESVPKKSQKHISQNTKP